VRAFIDFDPSGGRAFGGLREAANKLAEFENLSFAEISERLETLTRR